MFFFNSDSDTKNMWVEVYIRVYIMIRFPKIYTVTSKNITFSHTFISRRVSRTSIFNYLWLCKKKIVYTVNIELKISFKLNLNKTCWHSKSKKDPYTFYNWNTKNTECRRSYFAYDCSCNRYWFYSRGRKINCSHSSL